MTCYVPRLTIARGVRQKMHCLPPRETATVAAMDLQIASNACEWCGWEIVEAVVIPAQREDCEIERDWLNSILDECERNDGRLSAKLN